MTLMYCADEPTTIYVACPRAAATELGQPGWHGTYLYWIQIKCLFQDPRRKWTGRTGGRDWSLRISRSSFPASQRQKQQFKHPTDSYLSWRMRDSGRTMWCEASTVVDTHKWSLHLYVNGKVSRGLVLFNAGYSRWSHLRPRADGSVQDLRM